MRRKVTKCTAAFIITIVCLLICEAGIRLSGKYATLAERGGGEFLSLFDVLHKGVLNNHEPLDTIFISNFEFKYEHVMDDNGFRNNPKIDKTKSSILAFGDSFTEGMGTSSDSTWPFLLGKKSNQQVYNAGIIGSDPFYSLKTWKEMSLGFKPTTVIFAINYSDIADVVIRGGNERFKNDHVEYSPQPFFMPVYKVSHLFRAIVHLIFRYDYMFSSPSNRKERFEIAKQQLVKVLAEANEFGNQQGVSVKVYIHPVPQEYYMNLDSRLNFKDIDLLEEPLRTKGVNVTNLRSHFEEVLVSPAAWKDVSWAIDGHFNSKGYALMSDLIYQDLKSDSCMAY